jgi:hypothetical protein
MTIRGYPTASDAVPYEINFYVENGAFKYSTIAPQGTPPNYTYDPASAVERNLLPKVNNSNALPFFKYLDDDNNVLSFPVNIASIRAITISPSALDATNILTVPITVTTTVALRNFKTNL